jgi:hypothetical protein
MFFLQNRPKHHMVQFVPRERMKGIFLREAFSHIVLALPHPAGKRAGYADIQCAARTVAHDVQTGLSHPQQGIDGEPLGKSTKTTRSMDYRLAPSVPFVMTVLKRAATG